MLLLEVPESTLTGEQFFHDYFLVRYLKDTPTDSLLYWCGDIKIPPEIWLESGILRVIPTNLKAKVDTSQHLHLFFTFLQRHSYLGASLRLLVLQEVKSLLESWGSVVTIDQFSELQVLEKSLTCSYNFDYYNRTNVSISLSLDIIRECGINILLFKKQLFENITGLLNTLNKIQVLGVLK